MVFSSISFLYYFLPIVLLLYFIVPNRFKNIILFLSSFFFYFYGEPKYIVILILSSIINYSFALIIDKQNNKSKSKLYLILSIIINIGILIYYKYSNFFIDNINFLFKTNINFIKVIMPIGISFFTFQGMSYVIDVYRKDVKANKSFVAFSTYLCLFPQLIAGPIVRYITIEDELKNRNHSFYLFSKGVQRFLIGLSKKVLLANTLGELSKLLLNSNNITVLSYWIIAIAFTLQIYFDFSGYSDMAIGLGFIFGFKFLENFNYPLIASSITDFWRRWHISLSSWLRDYVYIPLGGNRVSEKKWIRNILIVWFLTGFWHGASWNFIFWGIYFAVILIVEKKFLYNFLKNHKIFSHIYTLFLVVISFVIFNGDSFAEVFNFLKSMFNINNSLELYNFETIYYIKSYLTLILIGIIASTPFISLLINKLKNKKSFKFLINLLEPFYYISLLLTVTAFLIDGSFNPFLYFRF